MKNSQARRRKYSQRKFLEAPEEVKELVRKAAPRFVVVDGGPPLDDRALISRSKARQLRGNVSAMTWWRWEHNASLNMPKAEAINGRYYYRLGEILNWSPPLASIGWFAKKRIRERLLQISPGLKGALQKSNDG